MGKNLLKAILLVIVGTAIGSAFYFDADSVFNLLQQHRSELQSYYQQNPFLTLALFFVFYVFAAAISFPGAAIFSVLGGFLFGSLAGTLVVLTAATVGATFAFLSARFLWGESIQKKFADQLKPIMTGMENNGNFYLLTLRLAPIFPFFVVNLVMGVTTIKASDFFWVSYVGMLPGSFLYVNAGSQLGTLTQLSDIMSPQIFVSFLALALFPLVVKYGLSKRASRS